MPAMKCPNPQCTFRFDPAQVPPGAVLVCPRCAMRYTLGTAPAAAAYPATAHIQPGDHPAIPADDQPTTPFDTATPGPVFAANRPSAPRRPAKPGGYGATMLTLAGLLAVFAAGIGVVTAVVALSRKADPSAAAGGDREVRVEDRNFAYRMPTAGWVQDAETQNALGVNVFALKREAEPTAWVAMAVTDFGDRDPLPAELLSATRRHLDRLFQFLPAELKPEPATWAGHAATKSFFRGELKTSGVVCVGEAYELAHKGVGYWFFGWAAEPDAAAVAPEFDAMRDRFRTLELREKWAGKVVGATTFVSVKPGSRFRLTTTDAAWKAADLPPTDEDTAAELLLKAELKGRGKRDFNPTAQAVVMVVPGKGDPFKVAEEYLRKRYVRDPKDFGPTDITPQTGELVGGPVEGLAVRRWKVSPGGETASKVAQKLVVFTAMPAGDAVVIAEASCPWSEHEVWERRLVTLVASLEP